MGRRLADLLRGDASGDRVELVRGRRDVEIRAVADDSRRVAPGALFVARPGTAAHGRTFVGDAIDRGAAAVLVDDPADVPPGVAVLRAADVAAAGARLAERFHGAPSRALALVGVTGTNGKTTTALLVRHLLAAAGRRCGLVGTIEVDDGAAAHPAALTTPGAIELSGWLRRMVDHGCDACVMEVSSHALAQRRVAGLTFAGAVFTNLSGDHLDYHGDMDAYADAKAELFRALPPGAWAVVNGDDPAGPRMVAATAGRVVTTTTRGAAAACGARLRRETIDGLDAELRGPWGRLEVALPLVGAHNAHNALQAAAVADALGVPAAALARGLRTATAPPGRLERVTAAGDPFAVLVDYAHTDDALESVLGALRPLVPAGGRLRVVFGCGGDRDRTKRPRMAAAACRHADGIVVTSDNPRTEDPAAIIDDVLAGVPRDRAAAVTAIVDRGEAIRAAVASCRPGDVLLVAGKGHETEQIIGTERRAFDDRAVAAAALAARAAPA